MAKWKESGYTDEEYKQWRIESIERRNGRFVQKVDALNELVRSYGVFLTGLEQETKIDVLNRAKVPSELINGMTYTVGDFYASGEYEEESFAEIDRLINLFLQAAEDSLNALDEIRQEKANMMLGADSDDDAFEAYLEQFGDKDIFDPFFAQKPQVYSDEDIEELEAELDDLDDWVQDLNTRRSSGSSAFDNILSKAQAAERITGSEPSRRGSGIRLHTTASRTRSRDAVARAIPRAEKAAKNKAKNMKRKAKARAKKRRRR